MSKPKTTKQLEQSIREEVLKQEERIQLAMLRERYRQAKRRTVDADGEIL